MNLDLTEAIAAVREYIAEAVGFDGGVPMTHQATEVANLVAPLIAAQVAEQIARAIEAERTDVLLDSDGADTRTDWLASGLARAARIVREAVQ